MQQWRHEMTSMTNKKNTARTRSEPGAGLTSALAGIRGMYQAGYRLARRGTANFLTQEAPNVPLP